MSDDITTRLERLEHFTSGWREESRRELAEHRALWRDTQRQINENARAIADLRDAQLNFERRAEQQMTEIRADMAERDQKIDKRITDLVLSIGSLIAKMDAKGDGR